MDDATQSNVAAAVVAIVAFCTLGARAASDVLSGVERVNAVEENRVNFVKYFARHGFNLFLH